VMLADGVYISGSVLVLILVVLLVWVLFFR